MNLASERKMNKTISRYLSRNILFPKLISDIPSGQLGMIIVIPCYDEPNVSASILDLANCISPKCKVEIIVSINAGIDSSLAVKERNVNSYNAILELQNVVPDWLSVFPIMNNELPNKKAGVGLGRKIGMDEAVRRFMSIGKEDGVIVCFDADSLSDPNYLIEIETHFETKSIESASINYEHPIDGDDYAASIYESIVQYELHLRYFIRMQKMVNLPYAYHTVGSSMACTASTYCAVGGMNQRKAGEDFYFIHKLVKFGKHSELNTTKVIPSPRVSDRVPFGTGRAVGIMQSIDEKIYHTYDPQSFLDVQSMVDALPDIYRNQKFGDKLPQSLMSYLISIKGDDELERIIRNTSDYPSFYKMFWHWFDAFVLMKYLHFLRDNFYPDLPVLEAVNRVAEEGFSDEKQALIYYRATDVKSTHDPIMK